MKVIELTVNGRRRRLTVADDMLLLDMLRDEFGVTSVREGCGVGACGACTVLVDGRSISGCLARAARYDGANLTTADGLPNDDEVIDAFVSTGAMQCGYCIPGFVLMAHELLGENPDPTPRQIAEHIAGNICRCGTYPEICEAIGTAAARRKSRSTS
jgi:aerobic-type carbon monoxide dehydrogenase small subunit (CoxS/CutS family)